MNSFKFLFCLALFLCTFSILAQESDTPISDEELTKYAVVMDSIDNLKKDLLESISGLVKNNDKISAARYNELSKIVNDETKLTEAKATTEEITALKEILTKKDEGTAKIQETFQSLAKEYVGATIYNKVKKALSTDSSVKARYETILAEIGKSSESD